MPIPERGSAESGDDFMSRCMSELASEYPDQKQRAAICHSKMSRQIDEEIFSVGRWNGIEFTQSDLNSIANSFHELKGVLKVPLKLGHNDEQPFTDGQPSLGWVDDVFVKGDKLIARFSDVPDIVFDAMSARRYTQKSIELDMDVSHKGIYYQYVLTGVALLGADLPAVNNLNDLGKYMQREEFDMTRSKRITFIYEDNDMSDDYKAQLAELKAQMAKEKAEHDAERMKFEREREEMEEARKQEMFTRDKESFAKDLESMVRDEKLLPAQRDELLSGIETESDLATRKYTASILEKAPGTARPGKSHAEYDKEDSGSPDDLILSKISELQTKQPGISFSKAKSIVLQANPKLVRAYVDMNDGV